MSDTFVCGTLCHRPLLEAVLGRQVEMLPASLKDHGIFWTEGDGFPVVFELIGAKVPGCLIEGLADEDRARLAFYSGLSGVGRKLLTVEAKGPREAYAILPEAPDVPPGRPWRLEDWVPRWGATVTATAGDVMALYGMRTAAEVLARRHAMLVRGASRARAGGGPTEVRRNAAPDDVKVAAQSQPYAGFFALEHYDLSFRRFDGSASPMVRRAAFISGDAVTVLPYDPVRDRVLLVEQFRAGPFARGDDQPWQLEAIAGRIDPGESPEEAARREAGEEAGLVLGRLIRVADYYPTPAAKSEFLYSFVTLADLPDGIAGVFGVAGEAEDIRGHLVGFEALMRLVETGEVANAPLILTALWLARERPRLRGKEAE